MENKLNVYSFVGVNKKRSRLTDFIETLTDELSDHFEVNTTIETGAGSSLDHCQGCLTCFFQQKCPLDKRDDFGIEKHKMEQSDLIILASPVYLLNVTADMKVFLDRIAYWSHLLKLRGKKAIVIASTSSSGSKFVVDYLETVLNYMGCPVIQKVELFDEIEFSKEQMSDLRQKVTDAFLDDTFSDSKTERIFQHMRNYMLNLPIETNEKKYWEQHNMLNCNSLDKLIRSEQKNVCKI